MRTARIALGQDARLEIARVSPLPLPPFSPCYAPSAELLIAADLMSAQSQPPAAADCPSKFSLSLSLSLSIYLSIYLSLSPFESRIRDCNLKSPSRACLIELPWRTFGTTVEI
jgi:hypothetical protein